MLSVLLMNRPDAFTAWGGDTTQMVETRRELMALGVDVDIQLGDSCDVVGKAYDLAHIFNIQTARHGIRQLRSLQRAGLPVAVSPIFWDLRPMQNQLFFQYHPRRPVRVLAQGHWRLARTVVRALKYLQNAKDGFPARAMLQEADLLLPNSHAEIESLALLFEAPWLRAKSHMVPNGVQWPRSGQSEAAPTGTATVPSPCVLQVGKIDPVKGQLKVIEAMMKQPDIPLVFVGSGQDTTYGRDCRALGAQRGNTWFVSEVPQDHVAAFYQRARVHVLPSMRESPGLASLEASLHGVNCVVSHHGPIGEYFGADAWHCDPEDLNSIRQAILAAWHAPVNGRLRTRIIEKFTWSHAAQATLEGYQRLLALKSREHGM